MSSRWNARGWRAAALALVILSFGGAMSAASARTAVPSAVITVSPTSGAGGTQVLVTGSGFYSRCGISIAFKDAAGTKTGLGGASGPSFQVTVTIPGGAALGRGTVRAFQLLTRPHDPFCDAGIYLATATFRVTGGPGDVRQDGADVPVTVLASIQVRPMTGPGGTLVTVRGSGFQSDECHGDVDFTDASGTFTKVGGFDGPTFRTTVTIPTGAAAGFGTITAVQVIHDPEYGCLFPRRRITGSAPFKVTAEVRR